MLAAVLGCKSSEGCRRRSRRRVLQLPMTSAYDHDLPSNERIMLDYARGLGLAEIARAASTTKACLLPTAAASCGRPRSGPSSSTRHPSWMTVDDRPQAPHPCADPAVPVFKPKTPPSREGYYAPSEPAAGFHRPPPRGQAGLATRRGTVTKVPRRRSEGRGPSRGGAAETAARPAASSSFSRSRRRAAQVARWRTRRIVMAMSARENARSQLPSISCQVQKRLAGW